MMNSVELRRRSGGLADLAEDAIMQFIAQEPFLQVFAYLGVVGQWTFQRHQGVTQFHEAFQPGDGDVAEMDVLMRQRKRSIKQ